MRRSLFLRLLPLALVVAPAEGAGLTPAASLLAGCALMVAEAPDAAPFMARLREAGDAEDDAARLAILEDLARRTDIDARVRADLQRMAAFVTRWLKDPSLWSWYTKEILRAADYDFGIAKDSPVYPLTRLYLGRMLVWVTNEYGNVIGYHDERRRFLDRAVAAFREARAAYPRNRIIGMYLGEPIPSDVAYPAPPDAPRWAALARENIERLANIVTWWIEHRLRDNGEYGGAWDDDCEMWRHWVPVMIAFEDPAITRAQAFFSRALLSQNYMRDGYTSRVYDVEHTAEPSSDTITPMMHLAPGDPEWAERARRIARLMDELWTGRNQRGMLQFKSTYFSARQVDPDPVRACDTPYHTVAVQPVLLLWLRTGDPALERLFRAWMTTWVEATARAADGKPAGVIPAAIRWPAGDVKGPGPDWWDPRHHNEPRLYEWPSAVSMLADALLLTYHMTRDEQFLAPLRSMAAIRQEWLAQDRPPAPAPGSRQWCGSKLGFLARTLAKARRLTGTREFDAVLARDFAARDVSGDDPARPELCRTLERSVQALRINWPGYTSEVRFTDRVFTFPRLFGPDMMFAEAVPACNLNTDTRLLYELATGDRGDFHVFPVNAVRWLTPPRAIAALVTECTSNTLTAELYHFGEKSRAMGAELYLLANGAYTFRIEDARSKAVLRPPATFAVDAKRTRIEFELPSRRACRLVIAAAP